MLTRLSTICSSGEKAKWQLSSCEPLPPPLLPPPAVMTEDEPLTDRDEGVEAESLLLVDEP